MMNNTEYLTGSNDEGLKRVQSENYAYLMESTSIDYITERFCDVTQIGGLLDDKGYGIAMKKSKRSIKSFIFINLFVIRFTV